ncbi:histidine kinase [Subsaximicrobium wynnwilliamsii]|uniref:Histidine kinase n=1 Tax=Subsaximicrobium wynnwilliamsii TaxID=291179 RepID=A0A5C6ZKF8_9FLAO|nr:histidine kinase [Subsaximicrobium wynnwilliamsii]TXD84203.1 histidine kinase [Subsaximicrobium wynnwilliamsii]TXD89824.1 histidine kinase [Subsaximicrobium wynnwilliamsii]TXE03915.1 histidine kinase [Subsaximicrobium wynnwilliamsii]
MYSKEFLLKKFGQLLLHVLFWAGVLFFYTYFFSFGTKAVSYVLSFSLFLMPITMATTYVSIYKLIPDYLITKRYLQFGVYSLYTLIISIYLIVISIFFGLVYLSNFESHKMAPISKNLLFVAIAVYLIVIVVSAFKILKINLNIAKKTKALETKILETQLQLKAQQLAYLKMQIHPHFLFNTLNTLYAFSLKQSKQAPDMILKLSNLLDYLLYQSDKPLVPIEEEVQHIKDYIALEKMRFNETLLIDFEMQPPHELLAIPPMLLLPFVENSFKHGAIIHGKLHIAILIETTPNSLVFSIKNSARVESITSEGIGLENIKKRLELLYPKHHDLKIETNKDEFKITLKLFLNEHSN